MTVITESALTLLAVFDKAESNYVRHLEDCTAQKVTWKIYTGEVVTASQIDSLAARVGAGAVVTNRNDYLQLLLPPTKSKKKVSAAKWAGSTLVSPKNVDVLVVPSLKSLVTQSYGKFVMSRYLTKLTQPESWPVQSTFEFQVADTPSKMAAAQAALSGAYLLSVDIETLPPCTIRCVSYTGFYPDGHSETYVFPMKTWDAVRAMRSLNATPIPKVCQNGKYECSHFFAYSAPMTAYIADTLNASHAWYAELPKDLGFISGFYNLKHQYWKDMAEGADELTLYHYNALDTWSTGEAFLSWLRDAPAWVIKNYVSTMSQVPAAHMCEMRGIKRDMDRLEKFAAHGEVILDELLTSLQVQTATPAFNPSSPKQVVSLLHALGNKDADSSDDAMLAKCKLRHPLNERILGSITKYREERKELSTYLPTGEKAKESKGRILFSLNPHGTDTGRYASKEHHFWCGLQVQNISADGPVKATLQADPGFEFWEADYSQAEARGVAYCSGDKNLLEAVESDNDFHSWNASAFFGIPYAEIYDNATGKTLNKPIRNLSKRVNHGANYNMGPAMLLQTMGEVNVREAQKLLSLPTRYSLIQVCEHLLGTYERTYPRVKGAYYNWIKAQVRKHSRLVGATGWTRYCFGDPSTNKLALNGYVAHVTQSLNAQILNKAFLSVFRELAFDPDFKLIAQIHDSILFQVRKTDRGRSLAQRVKQLMEFGTEVIDCAGIKRVMVVPVDTKPTGDYWGEVPKTHLHLLEETV